jgi:hypothetical protein
MIMPLMLAAALVLTACAGTAALRSGPSQTTVSPGSAGSSEMGGPTH